MAWKKNSPDAVERFDELVAVRGASRKIMFGCPVYPRGGQRYAILHQSRVVLRLAPFKGRPVKDRVTVPESIAASSRSLRGWVRRAVRHARETGRQR